MAKRNRQNDLPSEYKKGKTDFLRCRIGLSPRVLIPRPETEFWAAAAIADLKKIRGRRIAVLDIFSGSGCVGIAVLKKIRNADVDFADIDPGAVSQIKANLKSNAVDPKRFRVILSDIFGGIPEKKYDAVLANPPYVDPARIKEVQPSVLDYEPAGALFGGKRGMQVIKKFLRQAKPFLRKEGFIYLEFDAAQAPEIDSILRKLNYGAHEFFNDQFGRRRFAKITC